jgi:hypothetical protein
MAMPASSPMEIISQFILDATPYIVGFLIFALFAKLWWDNT